MKPAVSLIIVLTLCLGALGATSVHADGTVVLSLAPAGLRLQVDGNGQDDWHLESSSDLLDWSPLPDTGPILSGGAEGPALTLDRPPDPLRFYRARRTDGLYDDTLLRTLHLSFTQANWQTLLANGRNTGSNTVATLALDNGATLEGVGARYRGNTSYTGMGGGGAPVKKSLNLELDYTDPKARLLGYKTLNLNNAYGDQTLMREPLFFNVMRQYAVCPRASLVRLYINGADWGVYSFVQQQNGDLINEWFPHNEGDRWRAPNMAGGGGPGGGGPGGGGSAALMYLGTSVAAYQAVYELKTDNSTNAWERLIHAIDVLNNTPTAELRDKVEDVLAVDRWLWFLALENLFADDDSYWNKGADYMFYYEPESGRIHPIEHDGNEAFVSRDAQLSPVQGATAANRPVLSKLLSIPELRQRYLAHLRTALEETFRPAALFPVITQYHQLSLSAVIADPKKGFTMAAYTNDLNALKSFVQQRYAYLTNHAELRPLPPTIREVSPPATPPTPAESPLITARVEAAAGAGLDSVWLYHRPKSYGRFTAVPMFDDGAHGDGVAGDGVFGAAVSPYQAGTKVRFYVEARSANTARAAVFSPARAEEATYAYRVGLMTAPSTPVVLNEFMAANKRTIADPQGDYDDWIELRNLTDHPLDLTGCYLTDDRTNPRKWQFPPGTQIPAGSYLLVWADEDGDATLGLHANFKLSADGEEILLIDTDANFNAILDQIVFGPQTTDRSFGRRAADADVWAFLDPTPGTANP